MSSGFNMGGISTALSGITGIASAFSEASGVQSKYQSQVDQAKANARQQAESNYNQQVAARLNESQQMEILNRQKLAAQIVQRGQQSTAVASAAARGVTGATVAMAIKEYDLQSAMYQEGIARQQKMLQTTTQQNIKSIGQQTYSTVVGGDYSQTVLMGGIADAFTNIGNLFTQKENIYKQEMFNL